MSTMNAPLRRLLPIFCILSGTALFSLAGGTLGRAEVIVTVGSISLPAGADGRVPVYIRTTAADALAWTSFEFRIDNLLARWLKFTDSPDPAVDPTFVDPGYVFSGNSGDRTYLQKLGAAAGSGSAQSFIGGDFPADFALMPLSSTPKLLAWLPVTAVTETPPLPGDVYSISLDPTGLPAGNTGFFDGTDYLSFTSEPGTVTITALPEPSTLVLLAIAVTAALARLRATKSPRRCQPPTLTRMG